MPDRPPHARVPPRLAPRPHARARGRGGSTRGVGLLPPLLIGAALLHAGCEPPPRSSPGAEDWGARGLEPSAPEPPGLPPEAAPAAAPATPAAGPSAPPRPPNEQALEATRALQMVDEMLRAMRKAADAVGDGPPCEQAYLSNIAAEAARRETLLSEPLTAHRADDGWDIAPRARFLELCERLPEPMRRCAIYGHGVDHRDRCRAQEQALSPAALEAWRGLRQRRRRVP
ncbi:MAG: hypothetical protein OEY14_03470 [Myxococcales bacterium]|nr:hypothetical protein [Myxococcales bacterium]